MRCTTKLDGDLVVSNNLITGPLSLRIRDYAATMITVPPGVVDSGSTITPTATIANYGTVDGVGVPVTFYIVGTSYTSTKNVSITAGNFASVPFDNFIANIPRGSYTMRCTTQLGGDMVVSNNLVTSSFDLRVRDFSPIAIVSPSGSIDSGSVITPQVMIANYGTQPEISVSVNFYIVGIAYSSTKTITLGSGASSLLSFDNFTANLPRGTYQMRCTTRLNGDMVVSNNLITGSFDIGIRDYAVTAITVPPGTVDSNSTISPKAIIHNYGTVNCTNVPVNFRIFGTAYSSTKFVSLNSDSSTEVTFDPLTFNLYRNTYTMRCSTQLTGDIVTSNNQVTSLFDMRVRDFAPTQIISPSGVLDSGVTITPQVRVYNFGTQQEISVPVLFYIVGTSYSNTQVVTLGSGATTVVTFASFPLNIPRNTYTMRCTTQLAGDMVELNNLITGTFELGLHDFAAIRITAPIGTADSGSTIKPNALIRNYGTQTEMYVPVNFHIIGTPYSSTKLVTLAPNESTEVAFDNFTLNIPRGSYTMRCTTQLAGDMVVANNMTSSVFVLRVRDYGCMVISNPGAIVDSGSIVTPRAWVRNYGTHNDSNVPINFRIVGTAYSSTKQVTLTALDSTEVVFDPFTLNIPRYTYTMRCTTALTNDMISNNNLRTGTFLLRVSDASCDTIFRPIGNLDSTATIPPQAVVKNYGNTTQSFDMIFTIINSLNTVVWADTQLVDNLVAYETRTIDFTPWAMGPRGNYSVRCSTSLGTDMITSNDVAVGTFCTYLSDFGVLAITAPTSVVDSGSTISPKVWIRNYGTQIEINVPVKFNISDIAHSTVYDNTQFVTLASNESTEVSFDVFSFDIPRGSYVMKCTTQLLNDMQESNNSKSGPMALRVCDVGVVQVLRPTGTLDSVPTYTPQVVVANYGTQSESLSVTFSIDGMGTSYTNTQTVSNLQSGITTTLNFAPWTTGPRGSYVTRCSTALAGDMRLSNNIIADSFAIRVAWERLPAVPTLVLGKFVKDGGSLTAVSNNIYGFRGNRSREFYRFDGNWTRLESIGLAKKADSVTVIKKKIGKGAALCYDGVNTIYAIKGGGTREFWAYDIALDTWYPKAAIPSYRAPKGGSALVYYNQRVYLLTGGQRVGYQNFFSYFVPNDAWETTVAWAPIADGKPFKDGSAMTLAGDTIFALKVGGRNNTFLAYNILSNVWQERETIPMVHPNGGNRRNRTKDGAAISHNGNKIYAIKGGSRTEFWKYTPSTGHWTASETIPRLNIKSVPKTGAALASTADGKIYLIKGNNQNEFWRYNPPLSFGETEILASQPTQATQMVNKSSLVMTTIDATPNPFKSHTTIRYSLPAAGYISIKLYDASGRLVEVLSDGYYNQGSYSMNLSRNKLSNGVYFLRYNGNSSEKELKLIVE